MHPNENIKQLVTAMVSLWNTGAVEGAPAKRWSHMPWNPLLCHCSFFFIFASFLKVWTSYRTSSVQKERECECEFLDQPPHVFSVWRWYVLYLCEIKMQYELHKLGLRKTKIKVRSCSNSLEMFNRRSPSLQNGWVSDVFPRDCIQVFSSKLTSDSSIPLKASSVALFCLHPSWKRSSELWQPASHWHTDYATALNWEW